MKFSSVHLENKIGHKGIWLRTIHDILIPEWIPKNTPLTPSYLFFSIMRGLTDKMLVKVSETKHNVEADPRGGASNTPSYSILRKSVFFSLCPVFLVRQP